MKNLSKRTKMLLATAGVVIIVVVAGLVLLEPGDGLFGTTVIHISPTSAGISVAQSVNMSINSVFVCKWSTSNQTIARISNYDTNGDTKITANGVYPGQATIKANCAIGNRYATVTVRWPLEIIPNSASVIVGQSVRLTTGNDSCQWSASSAGVSLSRLTDGAVAVTGAAVGDVTVRATCDVGSASAVVHVVTGTPRTILSVPVITPATTTMPRWGHATWSTGDPSCTWFVNGPYLSLDTPNTEATVTAVAPNASGTTTVWAKCASGWAKPATVTVQ
jgi:hypothetical protein